jgi:hypothetical protein
MKRLQNSIAATLIVALSSCGGTVIPTNPVKEMRATLETVPEYTVLLNDMDLKDTQYKHQYKIIEVPADGKIKSKITDWEDVSDDYFALHQDDLGMELLSKKSDGKMNNLVTPPGFTNFVGNAKYGSWSNDSIPSWKFKSAYAGLEDDLGLKGLAVTQTEYQEYKSKYLNNRPYYGSKVHKDSTRYGTRSRHWFILYPGFYRRRSSSRNFYKPNAHTTSRGTRGGGGHGK